MGHVAVIILLMLTCGSRICGAAQTPLLLLVINGFRWDYQQMLPTNSEGAFHRLESAGVRAERVLPIFPSLSYASWTSIVTGRWSETHGIVGNHIFDQERGHVSLYNASRTSVSDWWNTGIEPIWTTAIQQRVRAAVIGFSRCNVPFLEKRPAFCPPIEKNPGLHVLKNNLALAINKLDQGFQFVIVYSEYMDTMGHYNVQDGAKMMEAVQAVEEALDVFFHSLEQRNMLDKVNFVMTSDHGMTEIGKRVGTNFIYLDLYLSPLLAKFIIERGAFTQIVPLPGNKHQILQELERMPNVTVYTKEKFPEEWHYANNARIPEILVLADPGTVILGPQTDNALPRDPPGAWDGVRGIHGYTANLTDMSTIFYAIGPDFKSNYRQSAMHLVDTYQILAHVLHVKPQPHNGSWERVRHMLATAAPYETPLTASSVLMAALVVAMA